MTESPNAGGRTATPPPSGPVVEMVELHVAEGAAEAFEAAVAEAAELFRAKEATSFELVRQVEEPQRYRLMIGWRTIEDHTVGFRESEAFGAWRALVTPHLAEPPAATHWASAHGAF